MAKWYRCNPYLGCKYEITEKEALKKINSRWWVRVWDDYWQVFSEDCWYDVSNLWLGMGQMYSLFNWMEVKDGQNIIKD